MKVDLEKQIMSLYYDIWTDDKFVKALKYSEEIKKLGTKCNKLGIKYKKRMNDVLRKMPTSNSFVMLDEDSAEKELEELSRKKKLALLLELLEIKGTFDIAETVYLGSARNFIAEYRYKIHSFGKQKFLCISPDCVNIPKGHGHGPNRDE